MYYSSLTHTPVWEEAHGACLGPWGYPVFDASMLFKEAHLNFWMFE